MKREGYKEKQMVWHILKENVEMNDKKDKMLI